MRNIPNIEKYTQEIINGELILIPKESYITEDEFNPYRVLTPPGGFLYFLKILNQINISLITAC